MMFDQIHNQLLQEQKLLYEEKIEHIRRVNEISKEIENIESKIVRKCLEYHETHDFVYEREEGMYGESFQICTRCGFTN
jgi:hypothetical protein|tara:strand:+ start:85 stop:321 length:237 start_codon:yes stop_codon:yes gene_type:complete